MSKPDESPNHPTHGMTSGSATIQWYILLAVAMLLFLYLLEFIFDGSLSLDPLYLVGGALGMSILLDHVRGTTRLILIILFVLLAVLLGGYLFPGAWWPKILAVVIGVRILERAHPRTH